MSNAVSILNTEQYSWGEGCDGWRLLKGDDLSVIQERVPPGKAEVMHYHNHARQFFYILEGQAQMAFENEVIPLQKGDGIEIPPHTRHRFENISDQDVIFLVISAPKSQGDRIDLE
jgi:mannose-6-phosphate isomerase-like protein (cupin superfamily)